VLNLDPNSETVDPGPEFDRHQISVVCPCITLQHSVIFHRNPFIKWLICTAECKHTFYFLIINPGQLYNLQKNRDRYQNLVTFLLGQNLFITFLSNGHRIAAHKQKAIVTWTPRTSFGGGNY